MKYLQFLILLFLSPMSFADEEESLVLTFSKQVKSIISSSDIKAFKKLDCHPSNCTNDSFTIETIFANTQNDTDFEKMLKGSDVRIKIIGPYIYESALPKSSYTVIFFSASNSPFDINGKISNKIGVRELYKSFLQTVVTI